MATLPNNIYSSKWALFRGFMAVMGGNDLSSSILAKDRDLYWDGLKLPVNGLGLLQVHGF